MKGILKGVQMLSSFNLREALDWLGTTTGREWTDSELFDVCTRRSINLHAAPPLEASVLILRHDVGAGVKPKHRLGWRKAVLYPFNIGQLWQLGETEPNPVPHDVKELEDEGFEWAVFDPPVRIQRKHLAIQRETLKAIADAWRSPSPVEQRWAPDREAQMETVIDDVAKKTALYRVAILDYLRTRGHALLDLPPYRNGRPNETKQEAMTALVPKVMPKSGFMKAWQGLLSGKEIIQRNDLRP